jgi:hypothetical protein
MEIAVNLVVNVKCFWDVNCDFEPRSRGLPRSGLGPPLTAGGRSPESFDPRSRGFSLFGLSHFSPSGTSWRRQETWLKPNSENARKRASKLDNRLRHPPSTAGLNRFAENPVNGVKRPAMISMNYVADCHDPDIHNITY